MHNPYLSEIIFALFFFKMTTFFSDPDFFTNDDEAREENRRFANPKTFGKRLVSLHIAKRRSVFIRFSPIEIYRFLRTGGSFKNCQKTVAQIASPKICVCENRYDDSVQKVNQHRSFFSLNIVQRTFSKRSWCGRGHSASARGEARERSSREASAMATALHAVDFGFRPIRPEEVGEEGD